MIHMTICGSFLSVLIMGAGSRGATGAAESPTNSYYKIHQIIKFKLL